MEEEEAKGADASRKEEKEGKGYENSWGQLSKRTHRLLRYDKTITDEDGWARLTTLNKRGLMPTTEKMKDLCMGRGGGGGTRFETTEQTEGGEDKTIDKRREEAEEIYANGRIKKNR